MAPPPKAKQKDFSQDNADKTKKQAQVLLAQVLPGQSPQGSPSGQPLPGSSAVGSQSTAGGPSPDKILAEMDEESFNKTDEGQSYVGDPGAAVRRPEDRSKTDAELKKIAAGQLLKQHPVDVARLAQASATSDQLAFSTKLKSGAGVLRSTSNKLSKSSEKEVKKQVDAIEEIASDVAVITEQVEGLLEAFSDSVANPTGLLEAIVGSYPALKENAGELRNSVGRQTGKKKKKERRTWLEELSSKTLPAPTINPQPGVLLNAAAAQELEETISTVDATLESVEKWLKDQVQAVIGNLRSVYKHGKRATRRGESSDANTEALRKGRNRYSDIKREKKPDVHATQDRGGGRGKASLQELYDAAVVDTSADPSRLEPGQKSVIDLINQKRGRGSAYQKLGRDKDEEALHAYQEELATLIIELKERHQKKAERAAVLDDPHLGAFADKVMATVIELRPGLSKERRKAKVAQLRLQLMEGIADIVFANQELEVDGDRVDPAFTPERQAETRALIDGALARGDQADMLFDMLDAGSLWPFGALHYVWKVNQNYVEQTGMDMFSFYSQQIVEYDFFRQREVKVNKVGVPAIQQAEKNFVDSLKVAGIDPDLDVSGGGYDFRSDRDKLIGSNLSNPAGKGRLGKHDLGLALDINAGRTARNPHVRKPPEIWEIVRLVVGEYRKDLKDVDPSLNLSDVEVSTASQIFARVIQASDAFRENYRSWKIEFRNSLTYVVPTNDSELPSPDRYLEEIRAGGVSTDDVKEMESLDVDRNDAMKDMKGVRRDLVKKHEAALESTQSRVNGAFKELEDLPESQSDTIEEGKEKLVQALSDWRIAYEIADDRRRQPDEELADEAIQALEDAQLETLRVLEALEEQLRAANVGAWANDWAVKKSTSDVLEATDKAKKSHDGIAGARQRYVNKQSELAKIDSAERRLSSANPELEELRILRLHHKYRRYYEKWGVDRDGVGFADQNLAFVLAMDEAGWKWGARFSKPDFHHFEYEQGGS